MINTPNINPTIAPNLCDALGLEADSFNRFLTRKDEALAQKDAEAEHRARQALKAELAWAE